MSGGGGDKARRRWGAIAVLVVTAAAPPRGVGAVEAEQLPNLVPLPPGALLLAPPVPDGLPTEEPDATPVLRFATVVANRGAYSLDVRGEPVLGAEPSTLQASQCVAWTSRWTCLGRTPVGGLVLHDEHRHWHFERFVLHEIRRVLPDGSPDLSDEGLVVSGEKASFCLEDTDRDAPLPTTDSPPSYKACNPLRQGISPGWADQYGNDVPGQWLPVEGLPDGTYALVATANPDGLLHEADQSDNVAWRVFELGDGGTSLEIREGFA